MYISTVEAPYKVWFGAKQKGAFYMKMYLISRFHCIADLQTNPKKLTKKFSATFYPQTVLGTVLSVLVE